jgi:hypothetical protein
VNNIQPTVYQERVLEIPEDVCVLLDGGRGSGKTKGLALNALRHCDMHHDVAHVLFVREHLRAMSELEDEIGALVLAAYPKARQNRQDHTIRIPGGGVFEFAPLGCADDYAKLQGRSFSLINCDEFGNMATSKWLLMLQSNLRAGTETPCRMALAANPGGRLHTVIKQRWLSKAPPWTIFEIDGIKWIRAPGTWADNPHLPKDYPKRLFAAAGSDRALYDAWMKGSWDIMRGSMFGDVLDQNIQMLDSRNLGFILRPTTVHKFVAGDYGEAAPTVAFACARLWEPQGRFPRGSYILLDEYTTADPEDLSRGIPTPLGVIAENIIQMTDRTFGKGYGRRGVFDNAKGLGGADDTVIKFFNRYGLEFALPPKSRVQGWGRLRDFMFNSHSRNGKPGFYATERCGMFWATVPACPRSETNPEDLDTRSNDHAADACRYGAVSEPFDGRPMSPDELRRVRGW